jgi:hypothetical protein
MAKYPKEVEAFHRALRRLVAVTEVTTGLKHLADFPPDSYSLPAEFGDLPHALLRRTDGGLKNEAWANTEFELTRDEAGWLTLEFLAWWVRDSSRGGVMTQMRPMALPPVGYEVQLGTTLKFIIDHFVICPKRSPDAALAVMKERADFLNTSLDIYTETLGDLVRPLKAKKPARKAAGKKKAKK